MPSPRPPRPGPSTVCFALFAISSLLACSDEDQCQQDRSKVESCDRVFNIDICATAATRCQVRCFARASCAELDKVDDGQYPVWLSRCLSTCADRLLCDGDREVSTRWKCDGVKDCVDGTDENGCEYHTCTDGQLVHLDAQCDEYSDCQDGSDEQGCPSTCGYDSASEGCP